MIFCTQRRIDTARPSDITIPNFTSQPLPRDHTCHLPTARPNALDHPSHAPSGRHKTHDHPTPAKTARVTHPAFAAQIPRRNRSLQSFALDPATPLSPSTANTPPPQSRRPHGTSLLIPPESVLHHSTERIRPPRLPTTHPTKRDEPGPFYSIDVPGPLGPLSIQLSSTQIT